MLASVSDIEDGNVRDYFNSLAPNLRTRLFELLLILFSGAPQATLVMKYGMPTLFYKKSLLHIAAWKNHCGVYPRAEAIRVFAPVLTAFSCSKGAIQLPHTQPFPKQVLLDIVAYRIKAIELSKP